MNRLLINAIFPGEPIAWERVSGHGARVFKPKKTRQAQVALARGLKRDAADGMKIGAIAKKHAVAWGTVQTIVGKTPKIKRRKKGKTIQKAPFPAGIFNFDGVLEDLHAKREMIDKAIAAVQSAKDIFK